MKKISLRDILPSPRKIATGNGDLEIRGLNLQSIAKLTVNHGLELAPFLSGDTIDFTTLAAKAPDMVAAIICEATGTQGEEDVALSFPVWLQIEAITAIWEESVPDLKKLVGLLSVASRKITNQQNP